MSEVAISPLMLPRIHPFAGTWLHPANDLLTELVPFDNF